MSTLTAPPPNVPALLTQTLDEFVAQQVAEQELPDEAAYFEKLAEAERQRKIWDYYEREVLRGLESGEPIPLTPEYWSEFLRKREERKKVYCAGENQ
jgi:methionyl-tRNA formyltransferase